jgi:hypothetical protein
VVSFASRKLLKELGKEKLAKVLSFDALAWPLFLVGNVYDGWV